MLRLIDRLAARWNSYRWQRDAKAALARRAQFNTGWYVRKG